MFAASPADWRRPTRRPRGRFRRGGGHPTVGRQLCHERVEIDQRKRVVQPVRRPARFEGNAPAERRRRPGGVDDEVLERPVTAVRTAAPETPCFEGNVKHRVYDADFARPARAGASMHVDGTWQRRNDVPGRGAIDAITIRSITRRARSRSYAPLFDSAWSMSETPSMATRRLFSSNGSTRTRSPSRSPRPAGRPSCRGSARRRGPSFDPGRIDSPCTTCMTPVAHGHVVLEVRLERGRQALRPDRRGARRSGAQRRSACCTRFSWSASSTSSLLSKNR